MIWLKEIVKDLGEMDQKYNILNNEIHNFIENPTRSNKKKVLEVNKDFTWFKVKLIHKISDFWCKGE